MADYASQTFLNEELDFTNSKVKVAIVTALWNTEVTGKMKEGAVRILKKSGLSDSQIKIWDVPGS